MGRSTMRQAGFTLVELMVTVTVLVILLAIAVPGMRAFTARNQVAALKDTLVASIALARMEAARQGVPVLLTAAAGGPARNELANGWQVCTDANDDARCDTTLRQYEALPANVLIGGSARIGFDARGYLFPVGATVYTICPVTGGSGFQIDVAPGGSVDVTDHTCS